ncbi:MAG: hypothetical protein HRT43_08000, partial [Campylobacteraceae bacterium]|nr:hypothetical protein [Campylobacteraceae bacterium]
MFKNLNLNIAILIALFMGLAIPMFLTTIYLQSNYEQNLKNELINTHKELLQTVASGLSRPMWEFMVNNAEDLLEPIFRQEDILEIKVVDLKLNNKVFLKLEKTPIEQISICNNPEIILLKENVMLNDLSLGIVSLKFTTCKIINQIQQQRDTVWFTMTVQFILSFMILFLLINKKILSPLKKLIFQSNTLAQKKLDDAFVWNQDDEIGSLGQSLEHTRVSLMELFNKEEKSKEKIKNLNKNLELIVEDRTKKLTHTIYNLELAQDQLAYSEKMASLGNMVSGIAHEINTPVGIGLTAVTYFQEITKNITLLYKDNNISQAEFEEYLEMSGNLANAINKNLVRASDLIGSFKKISVDQSSEENRIFSLCESTIDFINSMYGTLLKTKIKIESNIHSEIQMNGCPGSYVQVLMILVTNSLLHAYEEDDVGLIRIDATLDENRI